MRPLLKPALRRLWRDGDTLQLGVDPGRALVLRGLDPAGVRLLGLLDGTRETAVAVREAEAAGLSAAEAEGLLRLLRAAGALDDADLPPPLLPPGERERLDPDVAALALAEPRPGGAARRLAARRAAVVRVHGACRVGAALAALLAAAGVGRVEVDDDRAARPGDAVPGGLTPADAGRRRDRAAADALARCAPGTVTSAGGRPAGLVVLAGARASDPALRARLRAAPQPHLAAGVRDLTGVVGPLVVPGRTACLDCLDRHRAERDPAWPLLAAQLAAGPPGSACDVVLATAVAACAAQQALAHLEAAAAGRPEPPAACGGTLELTPPDHRWRRRSWPLHPDCACVA